ncbi:acyltransferase [Gordonia sp. PKS22-38]|uniref:Acyltransferase n=1 Tax=Gordonia prachuapensis TaxID=3115651 RepID=A0ABU7MV41_9ACTN|nr:acyltransferase [Gordonia sp. PKS22-38]
MQQGAARTAADPDTNDPAAVASSTARPPVSTRPGAPAQTAASSRAATTRSRAHTADLVRVLLFTGVVVAHSIHGINTAPDVVRASNLAGTLLHLTRYGFVAVTLFVLVLSTRDRPMAPRTFWRRRFGLVVWPYLLWTLIYSVTDHLVIQGNPFGSPSQFVGDLALNMIDGEGKYQLYFLLISMQIYLAFPAIAWLLRRTENRHWAVLGAAAAIQLTMFVVYQYLPRPGGEFWFQVYENLWKTLPMYALFVAIGALAAYHHEAVERWLRDHVVGVIAAGLVGTSISVGAYLLATSPGHVPLQSNTPWNPATLPWLLGGLALLWLAAMGWDDLRAAGRPVGAKVVSAATVRAFGVFAVHPLILDILARLGFMGALFDWFPNSAVLRSILLVVVTLTLSLVLVDLLLRTPLSRWLVARPRIPVRKSD